MLPYAMGTIAVYCQKSYKYTVRKVTGTHMLVSRCLILGFTNVVVFPRDCMQMSLMASAIGCKHSRQRQKPAGAA